MTETFNEAVEILGSADETQLLIRVHSGQEEPLQAWQDNNADPKARLYDDGSLQLGGDFSGSRVAYLEANADGTASAILKQGLQSRGRVEGAVSSANAFDWSVHELRFDGSGEVEGQHSALRGRIEFANTTASDGSAELRAGHFVAINTSSAILAKAIGLDVAVSNAGGGSITQAYGIRVANMPQNTDYAIHTGAGRILLGDATTIEGALGVNEASTATDGQHSALQSKIEYDNVMGSSAELQAGHFMAINTSSAILAKAIGLDVAVSNAGGGSITQAYGIRVANMPQNTDYAIHTGTGRVRFGTMFFLNPTANRIGIGTETPSARLHVFGGFAQIGGEENAERAVVISANSGYSRYLQFNSGTSPRWRIASTNAAESVGNAGSNLAISAFDDDGVFLGAALQITRASMNAEFGANLHVNGTLSIGTGTPDTRLHVFGGSAKIGGNESAERALIINANAGYSRYLQFNSAGLSRWRISSTSVAENGGNVGSNLAVSAFDNDGIFLGAALQITRASRNAEFGANLHVIGALSKGSGTFQIDHPLDPSNKDLLHGFVEAPRYDLIYRGQVQLTAGNAVVIIDAASNMATGCFEALTQNPQVWVQNDSGWAAVRGWVEGGQLHVLAQDEQSTDQISWLIVAERADAFIRAVWNSDEAGHLIPEQDKEVVSAETLADLLRPVERDTIPPNAQEPVFELLGKRGYPRHIDLYPEVELPTRQVIPKRNS